MTAVTATRDPAQAAVGAPCGAVQERAAQRCAEADRLAEVARARADEARSARKRQADLAWTAETETRLADRRSLREAKVEAQQAYHEQMQVARDAAGVTVAAANWLAEVTRLNHAARVAATRSTSVNREAVEVDALVRRLELEADAARIAAATAREACLHARRDLAACEEAQAGRREHAVPTAGGMAAAEFDALERAPLIDAGPAAPHEPAVVGLLRGDRHMLQALVARLAEEIGQDAGRLQLLLLELREAMIEAARLACAFDFPPRHPFWSQFSRQEARAVASGLATLGRYFDGRRGWASGTVANPRELAMAISLAGRDPRSVRRPPSGSEIATLWQGTTIAAAEHVLSMAPELRLEPIVALLGPRAESLADLWDNWGRLRSLLLGSDPSRGR